MGLLELLGDYGWGGRQGLLYLHFSMFLTPGRQFVMSRNIYPSILLVGTHWCLAVPVLLVTFGQSYEH